MNSVEFHKITSQLGEINWNQYYSCVCEGRLALNPHLSYCYSVNVDALSGDITKLAEQISGLRKQLEKSSDDLRTQFSPFLTSASKEVALVKGDIKEIEAMRKDLAEYFAEDPKMFKLEECFSILR